MVGKKLDHVGKYYIDGHIDAPPSALAKSLKVTVATIKGYISSKQIKAAKTLAQTKLANYAKDVPAAPATEPAPHGAKGPVPQGRDGITVMTEAAAMHADDVAKNITTGANKEWMEAYKNSITST